MKQMKYIIAFVVFTTMAPLLGQELLRLPQAWQIALQQNPDAQIARNLAKISKNSTNAGNADLLPKIDVIASSDYDDNVQQTPTGELKSKSTFNSAKIQAGYTLFDGFSNINVFKKLKIAGKTGQLARRNSLEQILSNVSSAYFAVAGAEESYRISHEALVISKSRLQRAENRAAYGQANSVDLLAAKVDFNRDSVSYINAKFARDEARRNLNVLLNRDVATDFSVETEVQFLTLPESEELKARALRNNAGLLLSENEVSASGLDLKIAKGQFAPRLSFNASYGYNQIQSDLSLAMDDPNRGFSTGLTLSLNLFNGFKNKIRQQNAKLTLENKKLDLQQVRLALNKTVENVYQAYLNSRTVLQLEKTNLQAAEQNFKRSSELYNLGQLTTTTFREAQLNLIRAQNSISEAKYSAKLKEIELLRISGRLLQENDSNSQAR